MAGEEWILPAAFYFSVNLQGEPAIEEVAFKEVAGLSAEIEVDTIAEGGTNDYRLQLPKGARHGNLVLKRALMPKDSDFGAWVRDTIGGGFIKPIVPRNVEIVLYDEQRQPLAQWLCARAWPVKWNAEPFESQKNDVAVESIELAYTTLEREK